MKNLVLIIMLIVNSTVVLAQERHTVLSITKEMHEISWYLEQQKLWKSDTEKDSQNAEAWYNYYQATRALRNLEEDSVKRLEYRSQCTKIAENAYKSVPNTFEGNHLMWKDSNNDETKRNFLLEAARISPNDARAFDDLMIYYEFTRNKEGFDKMCKKMYDINTLPASLMNWGYNLLAELEPNAIIFVHGDNDTYALWLTQSVKKFRQDVQIVNTSMMRMDKYRAQRLKEMNYPAFSGNYHELFDFMIENRGSKPVHISSSANLIHELRDSNLADSMYLVGLSYLYSGEEIDNISMIRRNYEKRYLIDYLEQQFSVHLGDNVASYFDALYLPSMVKLFRHYAACEQMENKNKFEMLITKIAERTGQQERVKELIAQ